MVDEAQSTSEIYKGTPEKIFDAARVQRWVNERTDRAERNARGQIARSLENDVRRAGRGNSFSIEEVQRRISSTKVDLEHLLGDKDRVSYKSKDSRTGGIVVAEVIRIAGGLVVQEVKPSEVDEKIVSRALIDQDKTELTLNYTGGDYEKNDANPGIIRSENYREATATTFNLLGKHIIRLSKTMFKNLLFVFNIGNFLSIFSIKSIFFSFIFESQTLRISFTISEIFKGSKSRPYVPILTFEISRNVLSNAPIRLHPIIISST